MDGSSSLTEGTGGISPLSLRRRFFFFGVVDAVLTGVDEAEDKGDSTLISIVSCWARGNGDLGIPLETGEPDDLLMSLTFLRRLKLLPFRRGDVEVLLRYLAGLSATNRVVLNS